MHSADLIGKLIYVFRGGDGKDYLNDLHIFNPGFVYFMLTNKSVPLFKKRHQKLEMFELRWQLPTTKSQS
jgi:hypothetical protein